ncbi:MAG: helix-turn-helix transcriptional regulator [Agathobacter sp.]|nr:helix-turn-helix transcriptional regulator [Agathobacter sp.]
MQYKNLRAIREDRDIKQREIANFLNVSQNTYSQYETGVISLTAEVLIKLADYYGVTIDYLLDRTNNPN